MNVLRQLMYISVIFFLVVAVLSSIGCGSEKGAYVTLSPIPATVLKISIPNRGECVELTDGLYVENEGSHADIYGNDQCKHTGGQDGAICNNLSMIGDEMCWIGGDMYIIDGAHSTMEVYSVRF